MQPIEKKFMRINVICVVHLRPSVLNVHGHSLEQWPRGLSKGNLKFAIGARNYKNHTAIGGRSALDLRAAVGVWCMVTV
jgi:hypothetical protein